MQQKRVLPNFKLWLMFVALSIAAHHARSMGPSNIPTFRGGLSIFSSEAKLIPGMTDDLTISCQYSKPENSTQLSVESLILYRWGISWEFIEMMSVHSTNPNEVDVKTSLGASVSGGLSQNGKSFLTLKWAYPNQYVASRYLCSVVTTNKKGKTSSTKVGLTLALGSNTLESLAEEVVALKRALKKMTDQQREQDESMSNALDKQDSLTQTLWNDKIKQDRNIQILTKQNEIQARMNYRMTSWIFKEHSAISNVEVRMTDIVIDGQRFYWSPRKMYFQESLMFCLATGGKLSEFSFKKLYTAKEGFERNGIGRKWFYVGLHRANSWSPWMWSTSEVYATNFHSLFSGYNERDAWLCAAFMVNSNEPSFIPTTCRSHKNNPLCTRPE